MAEMTTWFPERAFGKQDASGQDDRIDSRAVVPLQTQQNAVSYLRSVFKDTYGARALIGPATSGKSTIIGRFRSLLRRDIAIAQVNAAGLTSEQMLGNILGQFGYSAELDSADDLLRMLNVFALQQVRAVQAPLIIIENLEQMRPTALRSLCLLADLTYQGQYALRIVITGTNEARRLLDLSSMKPVSERIEAVYEVESLTPHETMLYLHGRLTACDVMQPDSILPLDVCDRMHELSGGNPGELCRIARKTLQQAVAFPATLVDVEKSYKKAKRAKRRPKLIVNLNGKVIAEYEVADKKMTIGRSSLADLQIHDERVSKFHALILTYSDALVIADLNSVNGTFVNSRRVSSTLLKSNDILSVSDYRIKVIDAPGGADEEFGASEGDTSKMKTLDDIRRQSATKLHVVGSTTSKKNA